MIDEKKIQEAAIMNADYFNPCRSTLDREEACRASFEDGVEWFKKALWHDASEMPKRERLSFSWQNRIVQSIIMLALCTTLWITIKTANGGA